MEIYKILDRFELMYPNDSRMSDLRRAYIDQDLASIFRLCDHEELRKAILDQNIHSIFRCIDNVRALGDIEDFRKAVLEQNLYSLFRLLPGNDELRKAVLDQNMHSIFRLLENEDLKKLILDNNVHSLWRILEEYTNSSFVYALKYMDREQINFDEDCLSRGQLQSKLWLVDELKNIGVDLGVVFLCAGWYGTLATLMFESGIHFEKIRSFDIDPTVDTIAEIFNKPYVMDNWKFKSSCQDIHDIDFKENHGYRVYKTNGEPEILWDTPDTIINTSCEHINNFEEWYAKIPNGKLVILQCNDYVEIEEHVNCHETLQGFEKQTPLEVELFSGEIQLDKYKRYMRIGYK
jgi:hypothetical protein